MTREKRETAAENYVDYSVGGLSEEIYTGPMLRDMEECDRPFERAREHGVGSLADADLLALILRSGVPGTPITESCRRIMRAFSGKFQNLQRASFEELRRFPGIGEVKAMQLLAMMEIIRRVNMESVEDSPRVTSSDAIARLMMPLIGNQSDETIYLVCLSQSLRLKKLTMLTKGVSTASVFDVKHAVRAALLADAQAVMLCHNHPSGQMMPSPQDDKITRDLKEACRLMNIRFLDHVIVGGGSVEQPRFYSYNDNGRL